MVVVHGVSVTPGVVVSRFPLPLPSSSSSSAPPISIGFNGNSSVSFFLKKHPRTRKIFAGNQSPEFDSKSRALSASKKVLVPDNLDDGASSLVTDELQGFSEESQILNLGSQTMEDQASALDSIKAYSNEKLVKEKEVKPRMHKPPVTYFPAAYKEMRRSRTLEKKNKPLRIDHSYHSYSYHRNILSSSLQYGVCSSLCSAFEEAEAQVPLPEPTLFIPIEPAPFLSAKKVFYSAWMDSIVDGYRENGMGERRVI